MIQKPSLALAAGLLGVLLAPPDGHAGTLDPALRDIAAATPPSDRIDVIVRCQGSPADLGVATGHTDRVKLLRDLRTRGDACGGRLAAALSAADARMERVLWLAQAVAAWVPAKAIESLARDPAVARVDPNYRFRRSETPGPQAGGEPADPAYTFWNLSETRVTDLWALGHHGEGVVIATLDTGVDPDHLDVGPGWRGGDNSWFDPHGEHATPHDADGHGTGVMGVVAGGNALGIDMGAAPGARWIAAKIFDDAGWSDLASIHRAFQWVLDPDGDAVSDDAPDVVNNSWGLQGPAACAGEFAPDIAALRAAGIAVVFAAGNSGPAPATSLEPANNPGSLSVAAVDAYGDVLTSSSRGPSPCGVPFPTLAAPGKGIYTAALTGGGTWPTATAFVTGTSFAAPHLAGVLGVLRGAFPGASLEELEAAVTRSATDLGASGPDDDSGAGYLDAAAAYLLLSEGTDPGASDEDGDGYPGSTDCDDHDPDRYPGAPEVPNDGIDQDCDGTDLVVPVDADADGYTAAEDCDDTDAAVHPGAAEIVGDGIDQDCNGLDLTIVVTRALYQTGKDTLSVFAGSALDAAAALRVRVDHASGSVDRALAWNASKSRWQTTLKTFAAKFGSAPRSVTVYGPEGAVTASVVTR